MTKKNEFTNEVVEDIIKNHWPEFEQLAKSSLERTKASTNLLRDAYTQKEQISNEEEVLLSEEYFAKVRKYLNPYTHHMDELIEHIKSKEETDVTKENLERLVEIRDIAKQWYSDFRKSTSDYRNKIQLYNLTFHCMAVEVDFLEVLRKRKQRK